MTGNTELKIVRESSGSVTILKLAGALLHNDGNLKLAAELQKLRGENVVIDIADLGLIDDWIFYTYTRRMGWEKNGHQPIRLVNAFVNPRRDLIEATHLLKFLFFDSLEEAIASFEKATPAPV